MRYGLRKWHAAIARDKRLRFGVKCMPIKTTGNRMLAFRVSWIHRARELSVGIWNSGSVYRPARLIRALIHVWRPRLILLLV
jgi:hypothetical protein